MNVHDQFVEQALWLLETEGSAGLTARAVCERVGVKAPTLYHHFGDLAGLHDTAVSAAFERFIEHKRRQQPMDDPGDDLLAGWDNYVEFARVHPRLYAAIAATHAAGRPIEAAREGRAMLDRKLELLQSAGRLVGSARAAAEIAWSSAHAAAMLVISLYPDRPTDAAIAGLRASVERLILPANEARPQ
jgi:AcrR family transcriptional regulator